MVRLLPFAFADGPHNMAADEVLLESAVAGMASLRFYGWSEPTVSLGYFQPERMRREDERLASVAYVRRPTGGGALVHHHEVTYALALPPGPIWQAKDHGSWLCRMHTIIAGALSSLGISTVTVSQEQPAPDVLCFHHLTSGDLVLDAAKIVGSAQRKQRGALLQHGAILLAASPHAPELPGIRELTGRSISAEEIIPALEKEFAARTGWALSAIDWTVVERQRIEELVQIKYSQLAWNQKR